MKLNLLFPVTLPVVLALSAAAHLAPQNKQPVNDVVLPVSDVAQIPSTSDGIGALAATWKQDANGFGRLTGELFGQNGGARLLIDALIEPDRNSPMDNPMQVGVVRGHLFVAGAEGLQAQSDLYVVGTFARLPDFAEANCLILRYVGGADAAVEVIGQLRGLLDLGGTQPLTYLPALDADLSTSMAAADIATLPAHADTTGAPVNDVFVPSAPPSVDHSLVAPFIGRWRIFG